MLRFEEAQRRAEPTMCDEPFSHGSAREMTHWTTPHTDREELNNCGNEKYEFLASSPYLNVECDAQFGKCSWCFGAVALRKVLPPPQPYLEIAFMRRILRRR